VVAGLAQAKAGEPVFEVVLPVSGRFVRMRRLTLGDMMVAMTAQHLAMAVLAARTCTIDDEALSPQQWAELDYEDVSPIAQELNRFIGVANAAKGVG
jgi:hypothetical protein